MDDNRIHAQPDPARGFENKGHLSRIGDYGRYTLIKRRIEEIDSGTVELVPLSVVRENSIESAMPDIEFLFHPDAKLEFVSASRLE